MIRLWKDKRRTIFTALLAAALAQAIAAAAAAWCVQHLFDELTGGPAAGGYTRPLLAAGFAAAAMIGFLLEVAQRRLGEGLALDYTAELRFALFDRHLKTPAKRLQEPSHGAMLLPFVGDLTALKQWVGDGLARIAAAAITVAALLSILTVRNPFLGAALALTMAAGGAVLLLVGRPLDAAVRELRRRRGALAGFVSSRLAGVTSIRLMARARGERKKVAGRTEALNRASKRRAWLSGGMRGIAQLTGALLILATLLAGMREIAASRLTPGEVVAALSLVGLLAAAMHDFGRGLEMWYPARTSRERISAALRQPLRGTARHVKEQPSQGGLDIEALTLAPALSGLSATASAGEVVLIEGPPGCGKSSLLGCIAQLIEPDSGIVLYRGRALRSLRPGALRRTIGFASPALPLLRGSMGMNLRYRSPGADEQEIADLLAACGLGQLVSRLPNGLDTRLSDDGSNLSTGERQSLLLARALLGSPPLLLIDSVDTHVGLEVVAWLAGKLRAYPGIVLMAASRPELTACATRVWRIEGGAAVDKTPAPDGARIIALPQAEARQPATKEYR